MSLAVWIALVYVVITTTIGFIAAKKGGGAREFFVAGGRLSWFLLAPFLMAEWISASSTIGVAETAYKSGMQVLWIYISGPIGYAILAFGLGKLYQSIKKITLGETYRLLFDEKTRQVCVFFIFLGTVLGTAGSFVALGSLIAPTFKIPLETAVWLSTTAMVVMAVAGGLVGIAWMNVVHLMTIIICFTAITVAAVSNAGGLGSIFASLPRGHLNPFAPGLATVSAWFLGSTSMKLISVIAVTAMFAAKDEKSARLGITSAAIVTFLSAAAAMLIGFAALVLMPNINAKYAMWEMAKYSGPTMEVMLFLGVIAAEVSTLPGLLLSTAALVTRDIFLPIKRDASDKAQILFTKIVIPAIAFGGAWFALRQPTILSILLRVGQARAIFAVLLLIAVLWRRPDPTAAFWTSLIGGASGFIWYFAGNPFNIEPLWIGVGSGMLTLAVASAIKKPSPYKGTEGLAIALADPPTRQHKT